MRVRARVPPLAARWDAYVTIVPRFLQGNHEAAKTRAARKKREAVALAAAASQDATPSAATDGEVPAAESQEVADMEASVAAAVVAADFMDLAEEEEDDGAPRVRVVTRIGDAIGAAFSFVSSMWSWHSSAPSSAILQFSAGSGGGSTSRGGSGDLFDKQQDSDDDGGSDEGDIAA